MLIINVQLNQEKRILLAPLNPLSSFFYLPKGN